MTPVVQRFLKTKQFSFITIFLTDITCLSTNAVRSNSDKKLCCDCPLSIPVKVTIFCRFKD